MDSFEHNCPTKVAFGYGLLNSILSYIPNNHSRVLVVSSKTAALKSGALSTIKNAFEPSKIECHYLNTVSPNPKFREIDSISRYCLDNKIDTLIAVGGGSVIDAAKAVSLCASSGLSVRELLKTDLSQIYPLCLIAVPTTAGTGSEVSKGAIITDQENTWKGGLRGDNIFPKIALLDPELTESMPKPLTLETGFDVITHSFESLISKASTPITRMYSKAAIELTVPALVAVAEDRVTKDTRSKLMYSSLLAGYNLANASTCLPHRLQYPIGAHTNTAHARGLAALYPVWFKYTYQYAPDEFNFITEIINNSLNNSKLGPSAQVTTQALNDLLKKIEMSHRLRDFGITKTECESYSSEVEGNLTLDPGCTKIETLNQIYKESW
jgi:alcohol dehydrogenase